MLMKSQKSPLLAESQTIKVLRFPDEIQTVTSKILNQMDQSDAK